MRSGKIVLCTHGPFDEGSIEALLQALALAPEQAPVVVDLSGAQVSAPDILRRLAIELAKRVGPVNFLGPARVSGLRPVR